MAEKSKVFSDLVASEHLAPTFSIQQLNTKRKSFCATCLVKCPSGGTTAWLLHTHSWSWRLRKPALSVTDDSAAPPLHFSAGVKYTCTFDNIRPLVFPHCFASQRKYPRFRHSTYFMKLTATIRLAFWKHVHQLSSVYHALSTFHLLWQRWADTDCWDF